MRHNQRTQIPRQSFPALLRLDNEVGTGIGGGFCVSREVDNGRI